MKERRQSVRCAALIGKLHGSEITSALIELCQVLQRRGARVLIESQTFTHYDLGARIPNAAIASFDEIAANADIAIVVGGDGTMLECARRFAPFALPLIGVNQGRLGFMTDIARDCIPQALEDLFAGQFVAEQRIMLDATIMRNETKLHSGIALNEVVLIKGETGRMIEIQVELQDAMLFVLRADGLIVATPTGSTAYALSTSGPILHPEVSGIAIVPLCAHALSHRPITINDRNHIKLSLLPPFAGRVHLDGQDSIAVLGGDTILIKRSAHQLTLLHPPSYDYYAMLREKLHWSSSPRQ